jgi:acyl-CoA reductase-like NAD-dependent aldehyde dehydrogenase
MLVVTNPYNQETVCELALDHGKRLNKKIALARYAQERWAHTPLPERIAEVQKGLVYFRTNAETLARDITLQMGKPLTQARQEVQTCLARAEYMISIAKETLSSSVLPPNKPGAYLRIDHLPLGVIYNIAPWNYPLLTAVNLVVPALLAGNSVLLKHSPLTPLCGLHFEKAFGELAVPNLVTHLVVTNKQASLLIGNPAIHHVAFTGSVATGRSVYQKAAKELRSVGLELGGNDPAYVAEDADLQTAVANIVDGACYNAGQSCCAVERVYVHRSLYNDFIHHTKSVLEQYRLGDPLNEATTMGPLARKDAPPFLEQQVQNAIGHGARLCLGGTRGDGNFFPPTLLANVPGEAAVMQEETFGPLVPVAAVADDKEAIDCMARSRYGLTASVWTSDRERAERFAQALEVGTVYQNRCDYLEPALPWSGCRESGIGTTLSSYGFYALTRRRAIHFIPPG